MSKAKKTDTTGAEQSFEERLERLETLGDQIKKSDIPLDEAVKAFEEGILLARSLEKYLEKLEGRIEILMNGTEPETLSKSKPELSLFDDE